MILKFLSYAALIVVSTVALLVLDEDPTEVSLYEWIIFAVLVYAGFSVFRLIQRYYGEHGEH